MALPREIWVSCHCWVRHGSFGARRAPGLFSATGGLQCREAVVADSARHYSPAVAHVATDPKTDTKFARGVIGVLTVVVCLAVCLVLYAFPASARPGEATALATINALLNGGAGCFLLIGYYFVRRGQLVAHRRAMLTAFGLSAVFLVTYLAHHFQVGSVKFQGEGWVKTVYLALLIPHIILAATVLPLALLTIYRGWTERLAAHRKIARITLPVWLYVSASGVAIYFMLYHL